MKEDNLQRLTIKECNEILFGCMLGDASIEKTFISIMHSIIYTDYIILKYTLLKKYFNLGNIGISNNWGTNKNKELRKGIRFRILRSKENDLTFYKSNFKNEKKNIIPLNYLKEYLTPLAIFFWYFDDGSLVIRKPSALYKNYRRRLSISLKSYSNEEIIYIVNYINYTFDLYFRPEYDSNKKIIKISTSSQIGICNFLTNIIKPNKHFIVTSMLYKIKPEIPNFDILS
jgi:hypothetical protein